MTERKGDLVSPLNKLEGAPVVLEDTARGRVIGVSADQARVECGSAVLAVQPDYTSLGFFLLCHLKLKDSNH